MVPCPNINSVPYLQICSHLSLPYLGKWQLHLSSYSASSYKVILDFSPLIPYIPFGSKFCWFYLQNINRTEPFLTRSTVLSHQHLLPRLLLYYSLLSSFLVPLPLQSIFSNKSFSDLFKY